MCTQSKGQKEFESGSAFGGFSLLETEEASETIYADSDCVFWILHRSDVKRYHAQPLRKDLDDGFNFLKKVPILENLTTAEILKLSKKIKKQSFKKGEYIFRQVCNVILRVERLTDESATLRLDDAI